VYCLLCILSTNTLKRINFGWNFSTCATSIQTTKKSNQGNVWNGTKVLIKQLKVLPFPCQYVLYLMLFIIDNQQDFFTNTHVHSLDIRSKNHLCVPALSLTFVQKGVSCFRVKIFNSLPSNIQSLWGTGENLKKNYGSILLFILLSNYRIFVVQEIFPTNIKNYKDRRTIF
jgi:hypothetical protein